VIRSLLSILAAAVVTLVLFLILPVLQTIGKPPTRDLIVSSVGFGNEPPPPPPVVEEEPPPETEAEEPPPELEPETQPLDLQQLELALNPGLGGTGDGLFGSIQARLTGQIDQATTGGGDSGGVFSLADLDQRPRAIFQTPPQYPLEFRRRRIAGSVTVVFMVDVNGRVSDPKVEKSTDQAFESPALEAVRQWRFEPGIRKGQPVPFRMRVPITFNAAA
jgi:protein TonB